MACGTWAQHLPDTVWHLVRDEWPLLLAVLCVLVAVRVLVGRWRRRVWRRHAARARWLQIVPPVTANPTATVGLWRLLASVLPAPRRWTSRPPRIVWEVEADPHGMRCGLWLPPGINPTAVLRLINRAWPGVRAEQAPAPQVPTSGAVAALALVSTQPQWLPLVEDPPSSTNRTHVDTSPPEADRLRAVYDGLASAGRTGGGLVQVHISRAPGCRVRLLRRAISDPESAGRSGGSARGVVLVANALQAVLLGVLDVFTPGSSPRRSPHGGSRDPYATELGRQARAKYAAAPHLLVAVCAVAAGPSVAAARAAAADITSGYGLLSAHFTRRRWRGGPLAARDRWVPLSRMMLASVDEAAALAGLPLEPAAYGLPAAASRRRVPTRETFRTDTASSPHRGNPAQPTQPTGRPRPSSRPPAPGLGASDDIPPSVWSTP